MSNTEMYRSPSGWGEETVMPIAEWLVLIPESYADAENTAFGCWYRDAQSAYEQGPDEVYISWPEFRRELINELEKCG